MLRLMGPPTFLSKPSRLSSSLDATFYVFHTTRKSRVFHERLPTPTTLRDENVIYSRLFTVLRSFFCVIGQGAYWALKLGLRKSLNSFV
jgi:hypothetical protein